MAKKKAKTLPAPPAEEREPEQYQLKGEIPFLITISSKAWDIKINTNMSVQFACFGQVQACMKTVVENQSQIFKEEQSLPPAKRTLTRTKLNDTIKFLNFLTDMLSEMCPYVYEDAQAAQPEKKIEVVSNMKIVDKHGK